MLQLDFDEIYPPELGCHNEVLATQGTTSVLCGVWRTLGAARGGRPDAEAVVGGSTFTVEHFIANPEGIAEWMLEVLARWSAVTHVSKGIYFTILFVRRENKYMLRNILANANTAWLLTGVSLSRYARRGKRREETC
jgi:hypothetical protein